MRDEYPIPGGTTEQNVRIADPIELCRLSGLKINRRLRPDRGSHQQAVQVVIRLKANAHERRPEASRALERRVNTSGRLFSSEGMVA